MQIALMAKLELGEGGELRGERGEMEVHKIRFAFLLEKYVSVHVRRGDVLFGVCVCVIPLGLLEGFIFPFSLNSSVQFRYIEKHIR